MNYTITPSADRIFILIKVKGNINRNSAMKINLEAHELGRRLRIKRYLVDVIESRNPNNTLDTYDFAYSDMRRMEGIDKDAQVAILVSEGDHSQDFVETTLINVGLNVRIFTDLDKARHIFCSTTLFLAVKNWTAGNSCRP